ncbi:MAG: glycosyltransferase, partial [Nitrososphaera sp.]
MNETAGDTAMNRSHKHSSELLAGDPSPHCKSKETGNIVGEHPPVVYRTNIERIEEGFNGGIQVVHHQDTAGVASRKIRVLFVITGLASGGATNVVLDLASHFNNHSDFDVELLTGQIPPGRTDVTYLAHELGINTQIMPSLINHINPIVNLKAVADIRRIMVQGNYDIVHTHSSVAGVIGRIAAFSAGVPVILHHVHGWGLHAQKSKLHQMLYVNLERLCAGFTNQM